MKLKEIEEKAKSDKNVIRLKVMHDLGEKIVYSYVYKRQFGDTYPQWYIFWGANTNVWYNFNRLFYLHIKCSPSRVDYTWIRNDGSILYSNYCTPTAAPAKINIGVGDYDTRRGNIYVCNIYARKWIDP